MSRVALEPAFEVTTSLRWKALPYPEHNTLGTHDLSQLDGVPLHYHRDRLTSAAEAFRRPTVVTLLSHASGLTLLSSELLAFSATLPTQTSTYKLRLTISPTGIISITASPPITSSLFPLYPSSSPFEPPSTSGNALPVIYMAPSPIAPSLHTTHKTTNRSLYNAVLSNLPALITSLPPTTAEVLLYNPLNQITECVYSTPYFQRGHEIITPEGACGGNLGVTRRLALEKGWCRPGIVLKENVEDGDLIWLSNAMRGFWAARVVLEMPTR